MNYSLFKPKDFSQGKVLLSLFLLALLVRVIGINYGSWFGDERINSAAKVLAGDLVPFQHYYPPFLNYITAIFFGLLYVVGRLFNAWYDLAEFRAQYFSDPTPFYITARFLICLISAAIAPLFYLIAKECGLKKQYALLVGLFGVLIPGMVLLSHISKSDVPLSVCVVLVFYLVLKKIKSPSSIKLDICIGLAVALALSFKQSYIFILFPFFTAYLLVFYCEYKNLSLMLRSTAFTILVSAVLWPIFNIGILLDFNNFLDYQKIQAVMSIRENKSIFDGLVAWWNIVADLFFGVNFLVLIVFIITPIIFITKQLSIALPIRRIIIAFWFSLVFGSLIIMYLSGARQQSGLWVPYMTGIQLLAALSFCFLIRHYSSWKGKLVGLGATFTLLLSFYGVLIVDRQAIAKPIALSVEEIIRQNYDPINTKILTSFNLRSPQTVAMSTSEYRRHERIAKKYSVLMPERASERSLTLDSLDAINYFNMPVALHGLANSDDSTLGEDMKAYAWPLQSEEWTLDYWLNKGFTVFILADYDYSHDKSQVDLIRSFNKEVKESCKLIQHLDPTKPLYIEFSATLYECG